MPLYEYECEECGRFEVIRKFSDAPLETCPKCSGAVHKLLSAPAIQFKGSGWYITDYARKGSNGNGEAAKSDASAGGDGAGKSGAKGADSAASSSSPSSGSSSTSTSTSSTSAT